MLFALLLLACAAMDTDTSAEDTEAEDQTVCVRLVASSDAARVRVDGVEVDIASANNVTSVCFVVGQDAVIEVYCPPLP